MLWEMKRSQKPKNMNSTEISYLNKNHICSLEGNAFVGLSNLKYLNLSHNNLLWKDSFAPGVFAPLINLENINLKCNRFDTFDGLEKELKLMRLEGLFITPSNYTNSYSFGEGFRKIHLKSLYLSSTPECNCYLKEKDNNSFRNLLHIEKLYVRDCHIASITEDALKPLNKTLQVLDISGNSYLTFKGMNKVLSGLINSTSLKELYVNRIHVPYNLGIEITSDDLKSLNTLHSLEKLFMDLNTIEVFNETILYPNVIFPPSLKLLTLAGNRLTLGKYVDYLYMARNLTTLDIFRQYFGFDPFMFRHHDVLPHITSETPPAVVCDEKINQLMSEKNQWTISTGDIFVILFCRKCLYPPPKSNT
ncbi:vasorin-like [Mya arenaria]|uniref:vasorin-like n=1 Tax=Mya arenaria TaxID=6604 RepID=UPI0022E8697E|nr:vasorin-like [Mya arenaria]